jgi:hypothetical protein
MTKSSGVGNASAAPLQERQCAFAQLFPDFKHALA